MLKLGPMCRSLRQLKREVKEAMQAQRPLFQSSLGAGPSQASAELRAAPALQSGRPAVAPQVRSISSALPDLTSSASKVSGWPHAQLSAAGSFTSMRRAGVVS